MGGVHATSVHASAAGRPSKVSIQGLRSALQHRRFCPHPAQRNKAIHARVSTFTFTCTCTAPSDSRSCLRARCTDSLCTRLSYLSRFIILSRWSARSICDLSSDLRFREVISSLVLTQIVKWSSDSWERNVPPIHGELIAFVFKKRSSKTRRDPTKFFMKSPDEEVANRTCV